MFERHSQPLLPHRAYLFRLARHGCLVLLLVAVSLGMGMLGYHLFEGLSWLDALVNASMLLGGMGPVKTEGLSDAGKLFAGLALYAGLVFIVTAGLLFAPLVHRLMHRLHWTEK